MTWVTSSLLPRSVRWTRDRHEPERQGELGARCSRQGERERRQGPTSDLKTLVNQVEAQTEKKISPEAAVEITSNAVIALICPSRAADVAASRSWVWRIRLFVLSHSLPIVLAWKSGDAEVVVDLTSAAS